MLISRDGLVGRKGTCGHFFLLCNMYVLSLNCVLHLHCFSVLVHTSSGLTHNWVSSNISPPILSLHGLFSFTLSQFFTKSKQIGVHTVWYCQMGSSSSRCEARISQNCSVVYSVKKLSSRDPALSLSSFTFGKNFHKRKWTSQFSIKLNLCLCMDHLFCSCRSLDLIVVGNQSL